MVQCGKPPPVTPACSELDPGDKPGKAAENGPSSHIPDTHVGDPSGNPGFRL